MVVFFCLFSALHASDEFLKQRILQQFTDTYGGIRDANTLASISIEGVQISDDREYAFVMRKKRPSSMRYRLERDEGVLIAGYNGEQAWLQKIRNGQSEVIEPTGVQRELILQEAEFESPLYRYREKPENEISMEGRAWVGNKECYILSVEAPDGRRSRYFLDIYESHILRLDRLREDGSVAFQTFYRNYKTVEGYPFAHEIESQVDGETVSLIEVDRIEVNPGILSFYFEVPE
jgi:hypothetical protein